MQAYAVQACIGTGVRLPAPSPPRRRRAARCTRDFAFPISDRPTPNPQTYGRVYDCTRRSDAMKCVLKQVPLGGLSDHDRRETLNEASILRSAQSKHVVAYVDSWEDPASDCLYIVMEHAGEDLSRVMKASGGALPEEDVWSVILPVARGLKHLHSLRILHRDLKPANIFRRGAGEAERVVIGDLGLGRVLGARSAFAKTGVGTPLYFSPELAQEKPYNDKSDVWAFGCLAHELLVGKPPFEAKNQLALASKIVHAPAPSLPDGVSPDLAFVIHKALTKDPERRPSMADLLSLSCVRDRARAANARAARDAETRRGRLERRLREDRAVFESERAAFATEKAEMESKAAALSLAVSLEDVEGMAERIRQLESANAALAARLEETETRLADAERARVALAGKLETAVSAAASAAATPYKPAASPASGKHARGASDSFDSFERSPGASVGSDGAGRKSPPASATKALVSASVSPPRDVPSRLAPPAHDEEVDVADDLDEMDERDAAAIVGAAGRDPEPRRMNDRYGAAGAEEDDASVPPSPIAPASAAESEDDDFCAEEAPGPEPSRVSSPAPRGVQVARSLLYDEDASFGSLASFGRSPAEDAVEDAADASVDSAAFSDDALDATAVSLEPSVSTIQSMSVASTPRASLTRSGGRASGAEATDGPAPPPLPALAYTHSVFRPVAPAPNMPRRAALLSASTTRKERRASERNERSGGAASKPAFGKRETAPTRPVARLPAKGGAPVALAALGLEPLGDASAAGDAEAPFAAVLAWRRARKGEAAAAPAAPPPVGSTSRVWDNRAILSLAPSAAAAFVVLYRCADGGRATPLRRAKLRGRRARGDEFVACALVSSRAHELKRADGVAPWRCAEIVPPAGVLAGVGGAWVELVLEFAAAAAVEEAVVLKPDARLRARFETETFAGKAPSPSETASPTPSSAPNETLTKNRHVPTVAPSPELRRWPGLAGGPVRVAPAASAATSPARDAATAATASRPRESREDKTPSKNESQSRGVFVEGRSPDGPLGALSFTPPDRDRKAPRDGASESRLAEAEAETPPPGALGAADGDAPAWPLRADQVAALLRRAERKPGDERSPSGSPSGSRSGDDAGDGSEPPAGETDAKERDATHVGFKRETVTETGGSLELARAPARPPFEPDDRALVTDLLTQAQLLQDAVSAAAERLNPGNPSRFARARAKASPEAEKALVANTRFRREDDEGAGRAFGARPSSFRRSRKLDLLRSIGHMANPHGSPPFDGLACESPALDATRSRARRPLETRDGSEASAATFIAAPVARRRFDPRDEDSPFSSACGSSPAFDESASMRRRRLEGLLEPRQLF